MESYDPHAMEAMQAIYGARDDFLLCGTKEAALLGADILVVCNEWKPFWSPDFVHIKETLKYPVIFDGRNLYGPARLKEQGIQSLVWVARTVLHNSVQRLPHDRSRLQSSLGSPVAVLKADNIILAKIASGLNPN